MKTDFHVFPMIAVSRWFCYLYKSVFEVGLNQIQKYLGSLYSTLHSYIVYNTW